MKRAVLVVGASCFLLAASHVSGQAAFIEGKSQWSMAQVQEYCKLAHKIDVAAQPAAFPNQDMLSHVNPEFAKRINAVMAVYQAFGGTDLGIVPRTGGLRTVEMQIELYKKGRQIKQDGKKRDGSKQDDWELRTDNDGGKDLYIEVKEDVVDPKTKKKATQTRRVKIGYAGEPTGKKQKDNTPIYGPVTKAWGPSGWHAYGMAVDFGYFVNGKYDNGNAPFQTDTWKKTVMVAASMGLRPGLWFDDPTHLEWHPKLPDNPANIPGIANNTAKLGNVAVVPGTALTDAQVDAGYAWKLPPTIYVWHHNVNEKAARWLEVFDLKLVDDWLCLTKWRKIELVPGKGKAGQWITYDPPARLFFTYTPTTVSSRSPATDEWARKWLGRSKIVITNYTEVETDRGRALGYGEVKGSYAYAPRSRLTDSFMGAWMNLWSKSDDKEEAKRWSAIRAHRIYDVSGQLDRDPKADTEASTTRTRSVDVDGYTTDTNSTNKGGLTAFVQLSFAWNRDTGRIGVPMAFAVVPRNAPVEIKDEYRSDKGVCRTVATSLPKGAFDIATPPAWPAAKPRPKNK
jgi:hypothetical protein